MCAAVILLLYQNELRMDDMNLWERGKAASNSATVYETVGVKKHNFLRIIAAISHLVCKMSNIFEKWLSFVQSTVQNPKPPYLLQ